jgi:hypothetical protein
MIDFHTHSCVSDGVLSPRELIAKAASEGIKYIALTDHNGVGGIEEAHVASKEYGVNLINGTELSCERNTHIIGLFLKRFDEIKEKGYLRQQYIEMSLKQYGFNIDEYGTLVKARDAFIDTMIKTGRANNKTFAIEHFLQPPFGYGEAIDLIHRAGGLAIFAHPNRTRGVSDDMLPDFVRELIRFGIDGIEVYQSAETDEYANFIKDLAIHNNLLISGGSDFHNPDKKDRELGMYGNIENRKCIPEEVLSNLHKNKDRYK